MKYELSVSAPGNQLKVAIVESIVGRATCAPEELTNLSIRVVLVKAFGRSQRACIARERNCRVAAWRGYRVERACVGLSTRGNQCE
jgi:hypothetical protein